MGEIPALLVFRMFDSHTDEVRQHTNTSSSSRPLTVFQRLTLLSGVFKDIIAFYINILIGRAVFEGQYLLKFTLR